MGLEVTSKNWKRLGVIGMGNKKRTGKDVVGRKKTSKRLVGTGSDWKRPGRDCVGLEGSSKDWRIVASVPGALPSN